MLYAIMVQDRDDAEAARKQHRDGHLAHFRSHRDRIALAGPLFSDDGSSAGSLIIFTAESEVEARDFICADPFHQSGVWEEPVIMRYKGSILAPEKFG